MVVNIVANKLIIKGQEHRVTKTPVLTQTNGFITVAFTEISVFDPEMLSNVIVPNLSPEDVRYLVNGKEVALPIDLKISIEDQLDAQAEMIEMLLLGGF